MNLSGDATKALLRHHKVPPERMLVVHDDLDLPVGKIRLRARGSHGGHNGIRSIIAKGGCSAFPRIKIGIGRPTDPAEDIASYVLGEFGPEHKHEIGDAMERAVSIARAAVVLGIDKAMSGQRL
mmetsp:Transcript_25603/g.60904  ORF Transcript_25603/g.60904 Transcript_25603/m.60904 type:complete len:124 (-) Transcript_25603:1719-2090(-)